MSYLNEVNGSLEHYGVKGMKWGVRRYQNYDGTYTKRGMERYRKAEKEYDEALEKRQAAKKEGRVTKQEYRSLKDAVKSAKRQMESEYKKLKTDKMADQGKALYKSGKTITSNAQASLMRQLAITVGGNVAGAIIANSGNIKYANMVAKTISIGGTAANAIIALKTERENKRLRAYYAH